MRLHNSHSPTHTTNKGDTVNHLTFNLTFPRLSRFCNAVWNTFLLGMFLSTNQRRQTVTLLYDCSLSPVRAVRFSSRQMDTQSIKPIQTSPRLHTFVFPSLLTPGGHLLIFQYLQISPKCSTSQIFTPGPSGAYANDCTTTEPNMRF